MSSVMINNNSNFSHNQNPIQLFELLSHVTRLLASTISTNILNVATTLTVLQTQINSPISRMLIIPIRVDTLLLGSGI